MRDLRHKRVDPRSLPPCSVHVAPGTTLEGTMLQTLMRLLGAILLVATLLAAPRLMRSRTRRW